MAFNSPLSVPKAEQLIGALGLGPEGAALDVGCGEGELLRRLHGATGSECLGLDRDAAAIERAMMARPAGSEARLRYQVADATQVALEPGRYDAALCVGATHAFESGEGAYPSALGALSACLRPGGQLLVGEGYWRRTPDPEYLSFLGEPTGIYRSHEENLALAESMGLIPMYAMTSSEDEWDHFEWSFRAAAERAALAAPEDEGARRKLERVREWNAYYRRFGRSTMGFGFYVLRAPT